MSRRYITARVATQADWLRIRTLSPPRDGSGSCDLSRLFGHSTRRQAANEEVGLTSGSRWLFHEFIRSVRDSRHTETADVASWPHIGEHVIGLWGWVHS